MEKTNHPKVKGELAEVNILAALINSNVSVSLPFGDNQRYDFIVDLGGKLLRAQCKYGSFHNGCIRFNTQSIRHNSKVYVRKDYKGDADIFIVWEKTTNNVLVIPVNDAPAGSMEIRVYDPKKKSPNIKWVDEYHLDVFLRQYAE